MFANRFTVACDALANATEIAKALLVSEDDNLEGRTAATGIADQMVSVARETVQLDAMIRRETPTPETTETT